MLKGSSICTPISSMPSSRNEMMVVAGTMAKPQDFHNVKGSSASQMTRKREVCLQVHITYTYCLHCAWLK